MTEIIQEVQGVGISYCLCTFTKSSPLYFEKMYGKSQKNEIERETKRKEGMTIDKISANFVQTSNLMARERETYRAEQGLP